MKKSEDNNINIDKEIKSFKLTQMIILMIVIFIVMTVDDFIDSKGEERRINYVKENCQEEIIRLKEDHKKEISKLEEDLQAEIDKNKNINKSQSDLAEVYDISKDQLILVSKCVDNYVDTFFRAYDRQHDYRYNYNSLCMLDEYGEVYVVYDLEMILKEDEDVSGRPTEFLIFVSVEHPSTDIKLYEKIYVF